MTENGRPLLGMASKVAGLFGGQLEIRDWYGPEGSRLYDRMLGTDRLEVDDFLRIAERHRGPVLELACGNGRTTIPFLAAGYEVVGLDASPDMLQRLADHLREPGREEQGRRLTTVLGDMSCFSLDRRFSVIVLGMGTVWMLDEGQRASLFRCVREHLATDGRFLVTLPEYPAFASAADPIERGFTTVGHDGVMPALCTFIEHFDPVRKLRLMSILSQRVEKGAVTGTALYAHWNHLISVESLEDEIQRQGLRVVERHVVDETHVARRMDDGRRRWLIEVGH